MVAAPELTARGAGPQPYDAILGLGSNMADKAANIETAIAGLEQASDIAITRRSRLFRTPPWGVMEQDWFVNACVSVRTSLSPHALLDRCQSVEHAMGRVRLQRWGSRIIDVDVLMYGDSVIDEPDLIIPHPGITERSFVLAPLADIEPDMFIKGRTVRDWLAAADLTGVAPLD